MDKSHRSVDPPFNEEEVPPIEKDISKQPHQYATQDISKKDNRAFWLACGCLIACVTFGIIDACIDRDIIEDSKLIDNLFEVLKYVITTSLGFFFATTYKKD